MCKTKDNLLNEKIVYRVLQEVFPKQNDYYESDYKVELSELFTFGIKTENALRKLLQNHLDYIFQIDSHPLDETEEEIFRQKYGDEYVLDKIEKKYWYAYPALLRLALELEFGDEYEYFASTRDEQEG